MTHINDLAEQQMGVADGDSVGDDEPHDTFCGWCDAHETAGAPHGDDCPLRVTPCRGCGSIHCDSACAEYRQWLAVAYLDYDAAQQDAYVERANLAYDAWLDGRDVGDALRAAARAASGGDADARP